MAGPDRLAVRGFLARFAFALLVTGATYNPTRYSYYAWARRTGWQWRLPIVFVGGLHLADAFLAALFWLFASWGWLPIESTAAISWIGLTSVTTILPVGMSWSRLRRGVGPS
jgi:uncharacterized protein DUF6524